MSSKRRKPRTIAAAVACALGLAMLGVAPARASGAPILVSTTPSDNATVRSENALQITATYDRALQEPPASSIQVLDRSGVAVQGSMRLSEPQDRDGLRSISFFPRRVLTESGAPYTVAVNASAVQMPEGRDASAGATQTLFRFRIDDTPPATPLITDPLLDSITSRIARVGGKGESGSIVTLYEGGNEVGETTVNTAGNWSIDAELGDGRHTVYAQARDAAENYSGLSPAHSFFTDATPPAPPTITLPSAGQVVNTPFVTIAGTTEPGATVSIRQHGARREVATANSMGYWVGTLPFTAGTHTITADATDVNDNRSAGSASRTFAVDLKDAPPAIIAPSPGQTFGTTQISISGITSPHSDVTVREGGTVRAQTTADAEGAFFTSATFAEGIRTIDVVAIDPTGVVSPAATVTFIVDLTAPAMPDVVSPAEGGAVKSGTVMVTGTGEPRALVRVRIGTDVRGSGQASASGQWTVPVLLAEGTRSIAVTAVDAAGNESPPATRTFLVDGTRPTATIATTLPALGPGETLSGSAADDDRVVEVIVTFSDALRGIRIAQRPAVVSPAGGGATIGWSIATDAVPPGAYQVEVLAIDRAGNVSAPRRATVVTTG